MQLQYITAFLLPVLALAAPSKPKPSGCNAPHSTSSTPSGPTSTPSQAVPVPFTIMSVRSASPIHYGQVNASGQRFYINRATSTYCPGGVVPCDQFQNDTTVVVVSEVNKPTGAGMEVTVPGGQQLYVTKEGELGYTQAHSAFVPEGAFRDGFVYTPPSNGQQWGYFSFTNGGANGFIACPTAENAAQYQVFANVAGKDATNCLGFSAFALTYTGKNAWQYT